MKSGEYWAVATGKYPEDDYSFKSKEEAVAFAIEEQKNTTYNVSIAHILWENVAF